jgi:glutaredoxin
MLVVLPNKPQTTRTLEKININFVTCPLSKQNQLRRLNKNVKQSPNRPGVAQRVPRSLGSQIS